MAGDRIRGKNRTYTVMGTGGREFVKAFGHGEDAPGPLPADVAVGPPGRHLWLGLHPRVVGADPGDLTIRFDHIETVGELQEALQRRDRSVAELLCQAGRAVRAVHDASLGDLPRVPREVQRDIERQIRLSVSVLTVEALLRASAGAGTVGDAPG